MSNRQRCILLAAMLVTFVTGSIHSFSVFLVPFEQLLNIPRADISLFYSFALVFLTLSVLFGYLIYDRIKPATMVVVACTGAGTGLLLSAYGTTWWSVFFGYSVVFGIANGLAYGYVLQLSGRALPDQKGFAMAAVTAAYAIGSVVFSLLLARLVEQVSLAAALATMGAIIFLCGLFSAAVLQGSRASYNSNTATSPVPDSRIPAIASVVLLWLAYGCSVFAGLMAIGHAAGIVDALGGRYTVAVWGAVFVGIGSAAGGFFAGAVIGRNNMNRLLVGLPMASALFLGVLAISTDPYMAIAGLSLVGFCYGALIAVYPFAVSELYGHNQGPKIYGRVFTAWGFSGLVGPWFAGILYDQSGNYTVALGVACVISLVSPAVYLFIMRQQPGYLARHRLHN